MNSRPYDIVLLGATGFTGQLTAKYLLQNAKGLKLALAGRNPAKLEEVRATLLAEVPGASEPAILLADSHDPQSLAPLCAQTAVVISTVGPYDLHGEALVAACVREGCDYVDLTGEPQFVSRMQALYGDAAAEQQVKIVHCCGFDSIPHDMGVYYSIQQLAARLGREALSRANVHIQGMVRANGDFSGGTWNSAVNAMPHWRSLLAERRKLHQQKFGDRTLRLVEKFTLYRQPDGWATPLPTIDPAIVVQSAGRYPEYGRSFGYEHLAVIPRLSSIALGGLGLSAVFLLSQLQAGRNWLGNQRPSGAGPSAEKRARSWFTVDFHTIALLDGNTHLLHTRVSGGDPGYDETAKMLAESALCLLQDKEKLPANYGVLTTAEAMGGALLERLEKAGIDFEVRA